MGTGTRIAMGIETFLISALSVAVLLASVDFGRIYLREMRLQRGVGETAVLVGAEVLSPVSDQAIAAAIGRFGGLSGIRPSDIDIVSVNWRGVEREGPGRPGDVLTIRVRDRVRIWTPHLAMFFEDGAYRVSATKSVRAEVVGPVLVGG
jgi:hypothetical protein